MKWPFSMTDTVIGILFFLCLAAGAVLMTGTAFPQELKDDRYLREPVAETPAAEVPQGTLGYAADSREERPARRHKHRHRDHPTVGRAGGGGMARDRDPDPAKGGGRADLKRLLDELSARQAARERVFVEAETAYAKWAFLGSDFHPLTASTEQDTLTEADRAIVPLNVKTIRYERSESWQPTRSTTRATTSGPETLGNLSQMELLSFLIAFAATAATGFLAKHRTDITTALLRCRMRLKRLLEPTIETMLAQEIRCNLMRRPIVHSRFTRFSDNRANSSIEQLESLSLQFELLSTRTGASKARMRISGAA